MPVFTGSMTVGTTPVQVDGNSVQHTHIHIRNNDSTKTLYVGNSSLTIANGLPVDKLASIEFDLPPGDSIHMVTDSGTCSVSWLKVTQ